MVIRRKDDHRMRKSLPKNAVRTWQGWLVPIFAEFPDDLFICYSDREWELVCQDSVAAMVGNGS